jgi:hypothetical protein
MASDRGYSAIPEGFVFVPGDIEATIGSLPGDCLDRVQIVAGYGVFVPTDVKLAKSTTVVAPEADQSPDALASINPEPVIEIPVGEAPAADPTVASAETTDTVAPASTDTTVA